MKKAVIYVRVSTQDQVENGTSIETQLQKLRSYAEFNEINITKEYIDAGVSGAKSERPALDLLKENIKNIDIVLIYKLDRLSRSMKDTMVLIEDFFKPNNVDLISLSENFDTSTPTGMAMVGMLSTFAQLERETIKERMSGGKLQSSKNGKFVVKAPLGYIKENGKLIKDKKNKNLVEYIFSELLKGQSISQLVYNLNHLDIANHLKKSWYATNIHRMVNNPAYLGHTQFMSTKIENTHEPYITEEQQKQINLSIKERNKRRSASTISEFTAAFRGLIKCPCCEYRLATERVKTKNNGWSIRYRCFNCRKNKSYTPNILDAKIENEFIKTISNKTFKVTTTEKENLKNINYEEELLKLESKEKKLKKAWFNELINDEELKNFMKEINKVRENLNKEKETDKINIIKRQNIEKIENILINFKRAWNNLYYEEKRNLLVSIIDSIEIQIKKQGHFVDIKIKNINFKV